MGDENAKLSIDPSTDPAEGPGRGTSREYLGDVRIAGDASGFRGTVETTVSNILTVASYPGKLVAKTGAIVRTFGVTSTAEIQVGSFEDGTEIEAPCDFANGTAGCLVFAKEFSAAGRLRIRPTRTRFAAAPEAPERGGEADSRECRLGHGGACPHRDARAGLVYHGRRHVADRLADSRRTRIRHPDSLKREGLRCRVCCGKPCA